MGQLRKSSTAPKKCPPWLDPDRLTSEGGPEEPALRRPRPSIILRGEFSSPTYERQLIRDSIRGQPEGRYSKFPQIIKRFGMFATASKRDCSDVALFLPFVGNGRFDFTRTLPPIALR